MPTAAKWFGMGCRSCCPPPPPTLICNYPSKFHWIYGECPDDIWSPAALANPGMFGVFHFDDQCGDVRLKLIPPDGAATQVDQNYFTNVRPNNHLASCTPHDDWTIGGFFHRGYPLCMESDQLPVETQRWVDPGSHWNTVPGAGDSRITTLSEFGFVNPWTVAFNAYHRRQFTRHGYEWDRCIPPASAPPEQCPENLNESLWDYAQRCWANSACGIHSGTVAQIVYRFVMRCRASIRTRIYARSRIERVQRFTAAFHLVDNDEYLARRALAAIPGGGYTDLFDRELTVIQPGGVCYGYNDTGAVIGEVSDSIAEYIEVDVSTLAQAHGLGNSVIGVIIGMEPGFASHDMGWGAIEGCTYRPGEPEAIDLLGSIYEADARIISWSVGMLPPIFGIHPPGSWLNDPRRPDGCAFKDFTGAVPIGNGFWVRGI